MQGVATRILHDPVPENEVRIVYRPVVCRQNRPVNSLILQDLARKIACQFRLTQTRTKDSTQLERKNDGDI